MPKLPIILIPARLASSRLPRKPLADIGGLPMIVQVLKRAEESGIGQAIVACDGPEIAEAVKKAGGMAIETDPALATGSDRIFQALMTLDPQGDKFDPIINLQGDVPTIDPEALRAVVKPLANPQVDIGTLVAPIVRSEEIGLPQVVKAVLADDLKTGSSRALYFSRNPVPAGEGGFWHHIGVYAYRRAALEHFVKTPPRAIEKRESLEQLRALSLGLRLEATIVDTIPLGVDTPEDLERARALLAR